MPQTFSINNLESDIILFRYARGIAVRHLGTSNLRNKRLFNQSMISKYLPILFAVFANSTVLSVMWAWWDPRCRLINLLKSAESDEWRSFECRLYFLSTYHCLKVNYSCLTILPTTRDCPGLSSLLWWEHSKHYFDAQNMYLHLLSRQITLLEHIILLTLRITRTSNSESEIFMPELMHSTMSAKHCSLYPLMMVATSLDRILSSILITLYSPIWW